MTDIVIIAFGESKSAHEWGKDPRARVSKTTILKRYRAGWAPEDAISKPRQKRKRTVRAVNGQKRPKPPTGSPLIAHACGRWSGVIQGRRVYLERWDQPHNSGHDESLADFRRLQADQIDGIDSFSPAGDSRPTIADLCNEFLEAKQRRVESGELSRRTFAEYEQATDRIVEHFGKRMLIGDVGPAELDEFRSVLSEGVTAVTLGKRVRVSRMVFDFAYQQELIDRPVRFGAFKEPSKKAKRIERNRKRATHGELMFEAVQIRELLEAADDTLKAFILLGINAALGSTDISEMPRDGVLDFDAAFLDYPRPKTGEERQCPLWPETMSAVRTAIARRGRPKSQDDRWRMFITKYGLPYVRSTGNWNEDAIGKQFGKLLQKLKMKRPGLNHYSLRRTFQTVAEEQCGDLPAIRRIMGHVPAASDMSSIYRQRISRERLQAVTTALYSRLFPPDEDGHDDSA